MPIYEYCAADAEHACDHCRDVFEVVQSMRAEPLTECPACHQPVQRLISRCGICKQPERSILSDRN
ncbi:MAG: hypothetical protein JXO22_03610, partial [Phycisphaerae bacterium]|nr:hypothetical protein [Phycisphaerae bacterium]